MDTISRYRNLRVAGFNSKEALEICIQRLDQIASDVDDPIVEMDTVRGGVVVSDVVDGHRMSRRYSGYSRDEAVRLFQNEVKLIKAG